MRRLLFALLAVVCVARAQAHDLADLSSASRSRPTRSSGGATAARFATSCTRTVARAQRRRRDRPLGALRPPRPDLSSAPRRVLTALAKDGPPLTEVEHVARSGCRAASATIGCRSRASRRAGDFPTSVSTIEDAIAAYTPGPAWAAFEEDSKGRMPGAARRRRRLRHRPRRGGPHEPAALRDAAVLYTIVGGEIVHSAPSVRRAAP